ncbi:hypothetical protein LUZ60_006074 [Juncus effusus]|nr:hypothetical protein LUZ60_006074 [Juncus effusus]
MASSPLSLSLLSSLPHKTLNNPKPQTFTVTLPTPRLSSFKPLSCASPSLSSSQVTYQDFNERDWSFVEPSSSEQQCQRLTQVVNSASLPPLSRVLVALPSLGFVNALLGPVQGGEEPVELPEQVVAYHESLVMLGNVKEEHDAVRCFQGDVASVPAKFAPFDAIFVCYFPGMKVSVGELLRSHVPLCSSGSRLVIFFDQGRETIEKIHRQKSPEMVISDLPDLESLKNAASANSFEIVEFIDEPNSLYLAVLKLR